MAAIRDIIAGSQRLDLAFALALEDLKDRYRRSYLGLAWIVLSFLAFILIKTLVFGELFEGPDYDFLSHLVIGFALFGFASGVIGGAANLFVQNRTWILSTNLPYTLYAHTLAMRSLAELGLIALAAVILVATLGQSTPAHLWTVPPAIVLYYTTAIGLCLLFAPIGARFRDFVYAVQTVMRMLFFATPIIWIATPGTLRGEIAKWNPLTYYLDIIRLPIIEGRIPIFAWGVCLLLVIVIWTIGLIVFHRTKRQVPIWL
jgi:ABC-type polysaccharide/polyol phosphate export permease